MKDLSSVLHSFKALEKFCTDEQFKGHDPYDGLNSKLFQTIPFLKKSRFFRLAWIQLFKRLPVNLRSLVGIDKLHNSKGIALFLSGYCRLYHQNPSDESMNKVVDLADQLVDMRNKDFSGSCWGYPFDWQARAFFQPKNTPTVVATTYAACALLDAYYITLNGSYLQHARSACDFVLKDLNRTKGEGDSFAFSYSPLDSSVVYNASLLGSRLLSRVYAHTQEEELKIAARQSVVFCCNKQKDDGSWAYGDYSFHQWVDNFHTGFNLECLSNYAANCSDSQFDVFIQKGLDYYVQNFFSPEGISKYYNDSIYPVDIHAPAQLVVTIDRLNRWDEYGDLVDRVMRWTIANMQTEQGYFIYQKKKYWSSTIPYMRWGQAWMFLAFSIYLSNRNDKEN
ncbi:MAG: hypothetical protein RLY35_1664 [Bacteroidota bacterium]|jgi:hypothetical protein